MVGDFGEFFDVFVFHFSFFFFYILVAVPKLIGMPHTRGEESLVLLSSLSVSMCVYFSLILPMPEKIIKEKTRKRD